MSKFLSRIFTLILIPSLSVDPVLATVLSRSIDGKTNFLQSHRNSSEIQAVVDSQALIAGLTGFISSLDVSAKIRALSSISDRLKYRFVDAPKTEQPLIAQLTPEEMADLHDNHNWLARQVRIWKTKVIQGAMRLVPNATSFTWSLASVALSGLVVSGSQIFLATLYEDRIGILTHFLMNVLPFPLARERDVRRASIYDPEGFYGHRTIEGENLEIEKEVYIPTSPNKLWVLSNGQAILVKKDESAIVNRDNEVLSAKYQGIIDRSWSRKRVVHEIQALDSVVDLSTQSMMHGEHHKIYEAAKTYWGSWRTALIAAGRDPDQIRRPTATPLYTADWVREQILAIHAEKGYAGLTTTALKAAGKMNVYDAARARFGDWFSAVQMSGLDPEEVNKALKLDLTEVTDRVVVKLITALPREVAVKRLRWRYLDRQLISPDAVKSFDRRLYFSLLKHFDFWANALAELGIPPTRMMSGTRASEKAAFTPDETLETIRILAREKADLSRRTAQKYFPNLKEAADYHFGNWPQALVRADVDFAQVVPESGQTRHTRPWILQSIRDRFAVQGYPGLTRKSLEEASLGHLYDAGRRKFGKWTRAVDAAGLDSKQIHTVTTGEKVWSPEFIISEIQRLHREDVDLASLAVREVGYRRLWDAAVRYLGGWPEAVRAAGLDYDNEIRKFKSWSADKVKKEIIERYKRKEDLSPTGLRQRGLSTLFDAGVRHYGSWGAAIEAAGLNYGAIRRIIPRSREAALAAIRDRIEAGLEVTAGELQKSDPSLTQAIYKYIGSPNMAVSEAGFHPRKIRRELGTGRLLRLWPEEIIFRDRLETALIEEKILPSYASYISATLMQLKGRSFRRLVQEGVLTEDQHRALIELDFGRLNVPSLAASLRDLMESYTRRGWNAARLRRVVSTALVPWSYIEKLQRTYGLNRSVDLIEESLSHPDMEAWIRRSREIQEQRGTLDREKHLQRFSQEKHPLVSAQGRAGIRLELQNRLQTLMTLLSSSPDVERYDYTVEHHVQRAVTVRITSERTTLPIRSGQIVTLPSLGFSLTVQGVSPQERTVTLQLPEGVKRIPDGVFLTAPSNGPLELQIEQLGRAIRSMEGSRDRTTGLPVLDRLLGLASMHVGSAEPSSVKKFFDARIPYRRTSDLKTDGDQSHQMAVQLAMDPTEVEFIEGPPGTGKTTVIAEIIRQAVARGKRVLLVSQMHQAVDNALAEVMDDPAIPCLRVGNIPGTFEYGTQKVWAGDENALRRFKQRHSGGRGYVIAGTNMGIATERAIGLDQRELQFDLLIMDESSRETFSGALVPLSYLKSDGKVIFVGDVKQLPPFRVTAEQRRDAGLSEAQITENDTSALEYFLGKGFGDRVMLSTNYRSHPLIAGLISKLFYDGDIHRRGWEDFDAATLNLRVIDIAEKPGDYYEESIGQSFRNRQSATQVIKMVQRFAQRGIALPNITIITPYLAQVEYLQGELQRLYGTTIPAVTTIDAYQGGENAAVIFDFVRSNAKKQIGFVKDLRRLNVGLSRAKDNLAIIWDSRTLTEAPKSQTPEDSSARQLFKQIEDYYNIEVRTFFPEPEDESESGAIPGITLQSHFLIVPGLALYMAGLSLNLDWLSVMGLGMIFSVAALLAFLPRLLYLTPFVADLPDRHSSVDLTKRTA